MRALIDLIRFRNTHPAFAGEFHLAEGDDHAIGIEWRNSNDWVRLEVDLRSMTGAITYSTSSGEGRFPVASPTAAKVTE